MMITKNNKTYQIEVERIDCWKSKITVYEIFENGDFAFIGKAISNDVEYAVNEILNRRKKK